MENFISAQSLIPYIVESYLFWSLFFGLGPMIWFYPLNELDFTGYEVFLLFLLSPVFTISTRVLNLIQKKIVFAALKFLVLVGIGSFQASTTFNRLVYLSVGTSASLLVLIGNLNDKSSKTRILHSWGLILSYFVILVGRIWYMSVLPTWSDPVSNSVVFTFGIINLLTYIYFDHSKNSQESQMKYGKSTLGVVIFTGIGFGSLLFIIHWIYSEVSTPLRWIVSSHPNPGPNPNPFGCLVLFSLILGILLSSIIHRSNIFLKLIWWTIASYASFCLLRLHGFQGLLGALVLGMFITSILPTLLNNIIHHQRYGSLGLFLAMITYIIEILFLIWTVAYNFVPGGPYLREHSDYLMIIVMGNIGISLYFCDSTAEGFSKRIPKLVSSILLFLGVMGTILFSLRYLNLNQKIKAISTPSSPQFTSAIWTYHFAYDNEGWPSFERSAQLLNDTGADIITLLESDASKPFLGNNDLASWLSERLGLYSDFGPSTRDHTWGTLLLSKYPIVKSKHHLLPSPEGELAPAVSASINISGQVIDFVVTHMGNDRDKLDRRLQARYLAGLLDQSVNPVVFMGYITSAPFSEGYRTLISKGRMKDIDETDSRRWCEYIMYRGLVRLGYARISHGGLSDTELQVAKFRIPEQSKYNDFNYFVVDHDKVPESQRFNEKFGNFANKHNWKKSHKFHMSTPKYFVP